MAFEIPKQPYSGKIGEVKLGTGDAAVTLGGEEVYPFHLFEGNIPNPPKIAMEVWDYDPSEEWPQAVVEPFKDVIGSPEAWAKKCVDDYGADIIVLQLKSTDPNGMDRGPDEAAEVAKKVADSVDVPLVLWGTANNQKDEEVLKKIAELCDGKNVGLAPVEEANHKGIGASALAYNHVVVASSPIDVNLAKQLNILLENLGVPLSKIIIDPTTGGLGYGLEYSYSVMERIRMAALTQEDDKLQAPIICNIANEIWKCKEAGQSIDEAPTLGDPEKRGIMMEIVAAVCYLLAGADVVTLRHPESVRVVRSFIDLMFNGGSAQEVAPIAKNLELQEADLLSIAPEPVLDFEAPEAEKAKAPKKPEKKPPKEAPKPKKEEKVVELKPKEKPKPKEEPKKVAEEEAKKEAEEEAKRKAEEEAKKKAEEEAKRKAEEEARKKAEEEARKKAEEEAKRKAEEEAKRKAEEEARARAEAKAKEREELLALRQKRAEEKARLEAERREREAAAVSKTPAPHQLSLVDKLVIRLERIHRHS